jgi:hypothetical protein
MNKKKSPDYGDKEFRIRKALERLGTDTPECLICGLSHPLQLELHHPAQEKFDNETIILCSNDHKEVSDWQKDHPQKIDSAVAELETIGHWLLGLSDLLTVATNHSFAERPRELLLYIAGKLREFGLALIGMARPVPTTMTGPIS